MRKAGSTQKWVKEEQSLNFFFKLRITLESISAEKIVWKHSQFTTFIKIDSDLSTRLKVPAVMLQILLACCIKIYIRKFQLMEHEKRE